MEYCRWTPLNSDKPTLAINATIITNMAVVNTDGGGGYMKFSTIDIIIRSLACSSAAEMTVLTIGVVILVGAVV